MKKIISLLMTLSTILALTACNKVKPEEAVWNGYPDKAFVDFLGEGLQAEYGNIDVSVSYEEGWDKSKDLDEKDDVSKGAKPYTYIITLKNNNPNIENDKFYFFMELKDEKLSPKGAYKEPAKEEVNEDKAEETLEELVEELEFAFEDRNPDIED